MIGFGALDWECIFHKTPPEQGGARRMLRMEQIEAIKRMSRSESISTIASALNIDWKTAKKYAEMDDFNVTVETKAARARVSKLDPYKPTIDRILEDEEQRRVPRK